MRRPRKSSGRMASLGYPNPVDVHVGNRMRQRRTLLGMSQEKLGEALGLTFQQVQKYERGANRIGSSRLFELGQILDVPVSFFFDDMPGSAGMSPHGSGAAMGAGLAEEGATFEHDLDDGLSLDKRETLELIRAYYRVTDPKQRRKIYELIKSMAEE